ncbi:MAG TPA: radical SAM family heme chaperone HemW [Pirellulales bacterium]|nr:radical SAM family heme chaperone HemW [Pirellulales bacterium]
MPDGSPRSAPARAAYIHVPFCAHRCGYCNFTLIAGREDLIDQYLAALRQELSWLESPRPVATLFIGGGTPTHLPPKALERLCRTVREWFRLPTSGEFSVEANPAGLDADRVSVLAEHGVTRLSLGAQSFDTGKLRVLERDHAPRDIAASVALARGQIASISLDLIFAAPGETLDVWRADLKAALDLRPDHLSTYGLTYERGAAFWGRLQRGQLRQADEELERTMYAEAIERLTAAGFEHYEVSNFARPGRRCRHNEHYWAAREYYAAGPGAARYLDGRREVNHRSTTAWLRRVLGGQSPVAESETLAPEDRAREALVLGLRRLSGVDRQQFFEQTGFEIDRLVGPDLHRHVKLGMLSDCAGRVRLTREGLFVSDALWADFLRC